MTARPLASVCGSHRLARLAAPAIPMSRNVSPATIGYAQASNVK